MKIPPNSRMQGLWDRMIRLGQAGANADVNHQARKEWEDLRHELRWMGLKNI